MQILSNKKFRIAIIVIILIPIIIAIINIIYLNIFSATINVLIAPIEATVNLNNQKISSSETIRVQPGNYHIEISMPGFESQSESFSISSHEIKNIYIGLVSNDSSTKDWYSTHLEDQKRLEQIGSLAYDKEEQLLQENYPIINSLPHLSKSFTIGYETSAETPFTLLISASSGFYNFGINEANNLDPNHDIANYPIQFSTIDEGYINPFTNISKSNQTMDQGSLVQSSISQVPHASIKSINDTSNPNYKYVLINYYEDSPIYIDTYRAILQQNNNSWSLITDIELILEYDDYPEIPKEIIKTANGFN